ncbi:MAG TPA: DegT/DnrJ/EryC1/StrS family aminotransferase [Planctomycetota bacterium]|nr:DegT/DnrJ/EryC1/StrS family aminotransferase [Planctomycetota bacterium]
MKKVPLLDLQAQYAPLREEIRAAIDRVCDSQYFILGPEVQALEEELARFCGATFAVGVSSGTDALLAALMAAGVGPGDEVVTSAYSFFATAGTVARLGAVPVFVDVERETLNLDAGRAVARITPRTKAILPVHLFGRCADLDPLLEAAGKRGIPVIEDAAQAIGATDGKGRQAGTSGRTGCFSFFPTKNLGGFGDGGLVTTNDPETAETLRMLRVHGMKPKYHHQIVGGNFRLDALQAAVLRVKLKRLPAWSDGRRTNAARYRRLFAEKGLLPRVTLPGDVPGHIYNQFIIRVADRDRLHAHLTQRGVGTEIYYPIPLHLQECFRGLGGRKGDHPNAEAAAADSLALPIYPELTEEQQRSVVAEIADFYGS